MASGSKICSQKEWSQRAYLLRNVGRILCPNDLFHFDHRTIVSENTDAWELKRQTQTLAHFILVLLVSARGDQRPFFK